MELLSNGEDINISCSISKRKMRLFLGLKEVCPLNSECVQPIKRIDSDTFTIPTSITSIAKAKVFCADENQITQGFFFKIDENSHRIKRHFKLSDLPISNVKELTIFEPDRSKKCKPNNGDCVDMQIINKYGEITMSLAKNYIFELDTPLYLLIKNV